MKLYKKILAGLFIGFVAIQFIQPARNEDRSDQPMDFIKQMKPPKEAGDILKNSCYDCHSNNTRYPWYSRVQPVGWFMANHIIQGKAELNFSEFGGYTLRRQKNKLKGMESTIKKGEMPISSYILLHRDAKLDDNQKKIMTGWLSAVRDSLSK